MKSTRFILLAVVAVLLMGAAASTSLVYKYTGNNTITGNLVVGNGTSITASGTGSITATNATEATTTDNAIARYDGTTGKLQNSGSTIDDSGNVVHAGNLTVSGTAITTGSSSNSLKIRGGDGGTGTTVATFQDAGGGDTNTSVRGDGAFVIKGTSAVKGIRTATASPDFGTVSAGSGVTYDLTVTGAAVGDTVECNFTDGGGTVPDGLCLSKGVTSANTVRLRLFNATGSGVVVGARDVRVTVISF